MDYTQPLAGLRILDFGAFAAGPNGPRLLADFGADVIKVEPITGDPFRTNPAGFRAVNRAKRSLAVDLKTAEGRAIVHALVRTANVIAHNMRPGVAERLGISYAEVVALNPRIVYLHAPGWGAAGPKSHLQSFQPLFSGYAGIQWEAAGAGNPPVPATGNEDIFNSNLGASAMLMGILKVAKSHESQLVIGSQLASAMFATSEVIVREDDGELVSTFQIDSEQLGRGPLHRQYRTNNGWITIVVCTSTTWEALKATSGLEAIARDARFAGSAASVDAEALAEALSSAFAGMTTDVALVALSAAGVPAEVSREESLNPVYFWNDESEALGRVLSFVDPALGEVREIGDTVRLSGATPIPGPRPTPALGQHTAELLRELGYPACEIESLVERAIVCVAERVPA